MNHLSADNSLKLNLRSNCDSCCKIDGKLKCSSFYKDEFTLILWVIIKIINVVEIYNFFLKASLSELSADR